jgi:UDP-glucose 4-epimerase
MAILVTGGAGYIGSHMVAALAERKIGAVVLDNLSKGHRQAVAGQKLYVGDVRDEAILERIFSENAVEGVIHFAADSIVPESVADPLKYYDNNMVSLVRLLRAMNAHGVRNIVFSSTAAVYGEPERIPVTEDQVKIPKSPYGETKLAMERAMKWSYDAYGIRYVALRYFNAAGAHRDGKIGEDHRPETHLIPLLLRTALRRRESFSLFGEDYPTKDGTCVRDYIHVSDLADAHLLALDMIANGGEPDSFNLGSGTGFSNKEIIETALRVTGVDIPIVRSGRRPGDPAVLIASSEKIRKRLGWKPNYDNVRDVVETAWNWHRNHPDGYPDEG